MERAFYNRIGKDHDIQEIVPRNEIKNAEIFPAKTNQKADPITAPDFLDCEETIKAPFDLQTAVKVSKRSGSLLHTINVLVDVRVFDISQSRSRGPIHKCRMLLPSQLRV